MAQPMRSLKRRAKKTSWILAITHGFGQVKALLYYVMNEVIRVSVPFCWGWNTRREESIFIVINVICIRSD
jgi:hypothetical protein